MTEPIIVHTRTDAETGQQHLTILDPPEETAFDLGFLVHDSRYVRVTEPLLTIIVDNETLVYRLDLTKAELGGWGASIPGTLVSRGEVVTTSDLLEGMKVNGPYPPKLEELAE